MLWLKCVDEPDVLGPHESELLIALASVRESCSWRKFFGDLWPHLETTEAQRVFRATVRNLTETFGDEFIDALHLHVAGDVFEPLDRHAIAVIIGTLVEHGDVRDALATIIAITHKLARVG